MTVSIRPERAEDAAAIRRVVADAFGGSAEADLFAAPGHEDAWMALALAPGALTGVTGRVEYAAPFRAFA